MLPAQREHSSSAADRGARIVIVESHPELALLLDYYLSAQGYRLELIARGDVAERHLSASPPDLVVLAWASPGVSGIELLRRLRRTPAGQRLPILLLATGRGRADAEHAIARGADDVATEPFTLGQIAGRIAALLREPASCMAGQDTSRDEVLPLNPMAQRLFDMFVENCGRALDRRRIHDNLWGHDVSFDRHAIDSHIARLRGVLRSQWRHDPISCMGDAGYRFDAP